MNFRQEKGFTLVELLVVAYILLVGICGILSLFVNTMTNTQSAWDITTATFHAEHLLEEMESKGSLADITVIDWNEWAQKQHLNTLPQERFTVTYADTGSDPLDIQVLDQWERKARTNNVILRTKLTK